jgi:hypothetical protein
MALVRREKDHHPVDPKRSRRVVKSESHSDRTVTWPRPATDVSWAACSLDVRLGGISNAGYLEAGRARSEDSEGRRNSKTDLTRSSSTGDQSHCLRSASSAQCRRFPHYIRVGTATTMTCQPPLCRTRIIWSISVPVLDRTR